MEQTRRVTRGSKQCVEPDLFILYSEDKGRCVHTGSRIEKGQQFLKYQGQLVDVEPSGDDTYVFEFTFKGKKYWIDSTEEDGSLGRLVNDNQKNPNCRVKVLEESGKPVLYFFAVRDIQPAEEILYDYGAGDYPWRDKKKKDGGKLVLREWQYSGTKPVKKKKNKKSNISTPVSAPGDQREAPLSPQSSEYGSTTSVLVNSDARKHVLNGIIDNHIDADILKTNSKLLPNGPTPVFSVSIDSPTGVPTASFASSNHVEVALPSNQAEVKFSPAGAKEKSPSPQPQWQPSHTHHGKQRTHSVASPSHPESVQSSVFKSSTPPACLSVTQSPELKSQSDSEVELAIKTANQESAADTSVEESPNTNGTVEPDLKKKFTSSIEIPLGNGTSILATDQPVEKQQAIVKSHIFRNVIEGFDIQEASEPVQRSSSEFVRPKPSQPIEQSSLISGEDVEQDDDTTSQEDHVASPSHPESVQSSVFKSSTPPACLSVTQSPELKSQSDSEVELAIKTANQESAADTSVEESPNTNGTVEPDLKKKFTSSLEIPLGNGTSILATDQPVEKQQAIVKPHIFRNVIEGFDIQEASEPVQRSSSEFVRPKPSQPIEQSSLISGEDVEQDDDTTSQEDHEDDSEALWEDGSEYIPSDSTSYVSDSELEGTDDRDPFPYIQSENQNSDSLSEVLCGENSEYVLSEDDNDSVTPDTHSELAETENQNTSENVNETCLSETLKVDKAKSSKDGNRVWDKKHCCLYCMKMYAKLPRHFEQKHGQEIEVIEALSLPLKSQERKAKWRVLLNKGDFLANKKAVNEKKGTIIPFKRPRGKSYQATDYLPCENCLAFFLRHELWRHSKNCPAKGDNGAMKGTRHQAAGISLLTSDLSKNKEFKLKILTSMANDDISFIARRDEIIVRHGEKMFAKITNQTHQYQYVKQKMRELGRFLQSAKKLDPKIQTMQDCMDPTKFLLVISAVRSVAGFDQSTRQYNVPSLALKLGHSLKHCGKILHTKAILNGDPNMKVRAENFITLCNEEWSSEISSTALQNLHTRKYNTVKPLPMASDLQKLNDYLESQATAELKHLNEDRNPNGWRKLASITLAQLVLFNRRRGGETERMEIEQYRKAVSQPQEIQDEIAQSLTPFERKLAESLRRVEIRGKRGRCVPILLTEMHFNQLEALCLTREKAGIQSDNKYVFAREGNSTTPLRSSDVLRVFASECGAEHPEHITSTSLRKHVATISQILNLKENELDSLANFLGHDLSVHRQFYRLPENTIQLAKIGKLLIEVENGTLSKHHGKSLDEIQMDLEDRYNRRSTKPMPADKISRQIVRFDAQQRLRSFKYFVIMDTDEYIVPGKNITNFLQLMEDLVGRYSNAASFRMLTEIHLKNWVPTNNESRLMIARIELRPEEAVLKHYRLCNDNWVTNVNKPCMAHFQKRRGYLMDNIADKLSERVLMVKQRLGILR